MDGWCRYHSRGLAQRTMSGKMALLSALWGELPILNQCDRTEPAPGCLAVGARHRALLSL
eukprot:scaffold44888_cov153-Amphora_coffeaeformis.AAC.2